MYNELAWNKLGFTRCPYCENMVPNPEAENGKLCWECVHLAMWIAVKPLAAQRMLTDMQTDGRGPTHPAPNVAGPPPP